MTVLLIKAVHQEEGKKEERTLFLGSEDGATVEEQKQKCLKVLSEWLEAIFSGDISSQVDNALCSFEIIDVD